MPNTVVSPNMGLPVAVVGTDPGPDWANNTNACWSIVDSHNHSPGQGVQISPDGLDINDDLSFGGNDATTLRSVRFTAQGSPLAAASDLGCIYESGVDLYYNDGNGNQVRITQSGSVTGSTGTITGLPSGTASASYSAGTFTFQSATNTPATMSLGPVAIASASASPKATTIASNASQSANISLTLPTTSPNNLDALTSDGSGNMAWTTSTGTGNVVRSTSPTVTTPAFSGVPTGTITAESFTPTVTFNQAVTTNASNWYYSRVGNIVTVYGYVDVTAGASSTTYTSVTIPIATATLTPAGTILMQVFPGSANGLPYCVFAQSSGSTLIVPYTGSLGIGAGAQAVIQLNYTYKII